MNRKRAKQEAKKLLAEGLAYSQIAKRLECSKAGAYRLVNGREGKPLDRKPSQLRWRNIKLASKLFGQGVSKESIEAQLGVTRRTVNEYLKAKAPGPRKVRKRNGRPLAENIHVCNNRTMQETGVQGFTHATPAPGWGYPGAVT